MAVYFIIGGSSGIGLELSRLLEAEGHRVYATWCRHQQPDTDAISFHPLNVMEEAWELGFLPEVIDGLVYCPGSISLKPFNRLKTADYSDDFHLNVIGAVKAVQEVFPRLKRSPRASVLFFSSVAVQLGLPYHSMVAASKGAVEGITRALAAELAPSVRVNCIAPSLTDTPLAANLLSSEEKREANAQRHPLKKIGTPADSAQYAAFLLSERAGWITGQVLQVDGGLSRLKLA